MIDINTWEHTDEQMQRLLASRDELSDIVRKAGTDDLDTFIAAFERIEPALLLIDDSSGIESEYLRGEARKAENLCQLAKDAIIRLNRLSIADFCKAYRAFAQPSSHEEERLQSFAITYQKISELGARTGVKLGKSRLAESYIGFLGCIQPLDTRLDGIDDGYRSADNVSKRYLKRSIAELNDIISSYKKASSSNVPAFSLVKHLRPFDCSYRVKQAKSLRKELGMILGRYDEIMALVGNLGAQHDTFMDNKSSMEEAVQDPDFARIPHYLDLVCNHRKSTFPGSSYADLHIVDRAYARLWEAKQAADAHADGLVQVIDNLRNRKKAEIDEIVDSVPVSAGKITDYLDKLSRCRNLCEMHIAEFGSLGNMLVDRIADASGFYKEVHSKIEEIRQNISVAKQKIAFARGVLDAYRQDIDPGKYDITVNFRKEKAIIGIQEDLVSDHNHLLEDLSMISDEISIEKAVYDSRRKTLNKICTAIGSLRRQVEDRSYSGIPSPSIFDSCSSDVFLRPHIEEYKSLCTQLSSDAKDWNMKRQQVMEEILSETDRIKNALVKGDLDISYKKDSYADLSRDGLFLEPVRQYMMTVAGLEKMIRKRDMERQQTRQQIISDAQRLTLAIREGHLDECCLSKAYEHLRDEGIYDKELNQYDFAVKMYEEQAEKKKEQELSQQKDQADAGRSVKKMSLSNLALLLQNLGYPQSSHMHPIYADLMGYNDKSYPERIERLTRHLREMAPAPTYEDFEWAQKVLLTAGQNIDHGQIGNIMRWHPELKQDYHKAASDFLEKSQSHIT